MAKKGSRRTGAAGIDLSSTTGFLRYVSGQDPSAVDYASQAQAEATSNQNNTALMTSLRVHQAISVRMSGASVSTKLNQGSAPTQAANAAQNDDQGNAFRAGSLWQHVKVDPPTSESDVDWYRLEGFLGTNNANGSPNAVWAPAEQVDASVLTAITNDVAALETEVDTLQSQMAVQRAVTFESTGLVTVDTDEVIIELSSVPNNNSSRVSGQTSGDQGLFPFLEDEDYTVFGSWLFFRNGAGNRAVDDGDVLDIDWFTDLSRPGQVSSFAQSGSNLAWTDTATGGTLTLYSCPSASDPTVAANWSAMIATPDEADESVAHGLSTGDRVIARLLVSGKYGIWTDIVTIV